MKSPSVNSRRHHCRSLRSGDHGYLSPTSQQTNHSFFLILSRLGVDSSSRHFIGRAHQGSEGMKTRRARSVGALAVLLFPMLANAQFTITPIVTTSTPVP